jgi:geranylgeranyl pyrophosphate synthase
MLATIEIEDDRRPSEDEARRIVEAVRNSHGPQRALEQARNHANAARDQLKALPDCEATATLAALADYVVSRKL